MAGGIGDSWGTREELLHPRGPDGRWIRKAGIAKGIISRVLDFLASFRPRTFQNQRQANQYLLNAAGRAGRKRMGRADHVRLRQDLSPANADLRDGVIDEPSTKRFVDMMDRAAVELPDDTILARVVGVDAFGFTPETAKGTNSDTDPGIRGMSGKLVADRGYGLHVVGDIEAQAPAGTVRMVVAAKKGTKVIIPGAGPSDSTIFTDRDQPLRVTKIRPDASGGWTMFVTADERGGKKVPEPIGGPIGEGRKPSKEREATIRDTMQRLARQEKQPDEQAEQEDIAARQRAAEEAARTPAVPSPAQRAEEQRVAQLPQQPAPGEPPPRTEPVVGRVGEAPAAGTGTPAASPAAGAPQPTPSGRTVDIRAAVREAGISSPSRGKQLQEWNEAYLGLKSGKLEPDEAARNLDANIRRNRGLVDDLQTREGNEAQIADLEANITSQEELRDLIREQYGLPEAAPAKKAAPAEKRTAAGLPKVTKPQVATRTSKREQEAEARNVEAAKQAAKAPTPVKKAPAAKAAKKATGPTLTQDQEDRILSQARKLSGPPRNSEEKRLLDTAAEISERRQLGTISRRQAGTATVAEAPMKAFAPKKAAPAKKAPASPERLRSIGIDLTPEQRRDYTDLSLEEQKEYRRFRRQQGQSHEEALQNARDLVGQRNVTRAERAERGLAKKATPAKKATQAEIDEAEARFRREMEEELKGADFEHEQVLQERAEQERATRNRVPVKKATKKAAPAKKELPQALADRVAAGDITEQQAQDIASSPSVAERWGMKGNIFDEVLSNPRKRAVKKAAPEAPGDDLDKMTKPELLALAKREGVQRPSSMNKDQLKTGIRRMREIGPVEPSSTVGVENQIQDLMGVDKKPTVADLRAFAKKHGIAVGPRDRRSDLISTLLTLGPDRMRGGAPSAPAPVKKAAAPSTPPTPDSIRQQLISMPPDQHFPFLEDTLQPLNTTQSRALARGLGVKGAGRSEKPEIALRIAQHFEGVGDVEAARRLGDGPSGHPGDTGMARALVPEEQARQVKLDRVKAYGTIGTEVDELVTNGASPKALTARLRTRGKQQLIPDEDMADLLQAAEAGDNDRVRALARQLMDREGIRQIGSTDAIVALDPKNQESLAGGGLPRDTTVVRVIRPGTRATVDGDDVLIDRAVVDPASPDEVREFQRARQLVPEGSVQGTRTDTPVDNAPRSRELRKAWIGADLAPPPPGSGRKSHEEIKGDLVAGRITPEEAIRRYESEIAFGKEDLAEVDAHLRETDLSPDERGKVERHRANLQATIDAHEKNSVFLRDYFKEEAPVVSLKEAKEQDPVSYEFLKDAKPDDMREAAKEAGLDAPSGDTVDEMFTDLLKQVARKELERRAAKKAVKKAPAKKVAKAAPAVPKEKERVDARLLAEGLDLDESTLDMVQRGLDGESVSGTPKNPSPRQIADKLDFHARGVRDSTAIRYGNWDTATPYGERDPEQAAQMKRDWDAGMARAQALQDLAERVRGVRRRSTVKKAAPEKKAPEVVQLQDKVDTLEKSRIDRALEDMQGAKSRDKADEALEGLTMPELRRLAEQSGVGSARSKRALRDKLLDRFKPEPGPEPPIPGGAALRPRTLGARAREAGIQHPGQTFSDVDSAIGEADRRLQGGESPTTVARFLRERATRVSRADIMEEGRRFKTEKDKDSLLSIRKSNAEYLRRVATHVQQEGKPAKKAPAKKATPGTGGVTPENMAVLTRGGYRNSEPPPSAPGASDERKAEIKKLRDRARITRELAGMRQANNPPGSFHHNKGLQDEKDADRLDAEADALERGSVPARPAPKAEPPSLPMGSFRQARQERLDRRAAVGITGAPTEDDARTALSRLSRAQLKKAFERTNTKYVLSDRESVYKLGDQQGKAFGTVATDEDLREALVAEVVGRARRTDGDAGPRLAHAELVDLALDLHSPTPAAPAKKAPAKKAAPARPALSVVRGEGKGGGRAVSPPEGSRRLSVVPGAKPEGGPLPDTFTGRTTDSRGRIITRDRPNADEPLYLPNNGNDQGRMHLDSEFGGLWQALYQDDREPNSFVNEIARMGEQVGTGQLPLSQALTRLARMKERSTDQTVANRIQKAIDAMDAPPVTVPDLPDTVPASIREALRKLADIPTARRKGRGGTPSVFEQKLDIIRRLDAGDEERRLDMMLRERDLHESVDGALEMWRLFENIDMRELMKWRRESYRRAHPEQYSAFTLVPV